MRSRWRAAVAAAAIVCVLAGALLGYLVLRPSAAATPTDALPAPHFVDETGTAGINQTYDGAEPYSVGGGVAVLDCNGDGKPDVYVAGGSGPSGLYRNESPRGGSLKFAKVADSGADLAGVLGAYPIDFNGDGIADLAVLRLGGATLLQGLGGCRFRPASDALGFADVGYDTAFSAKWEGSASLPTLAIGRYRKLDSTGKPTFDCDDDVLFRPSAAGDAYGPPLPLSPGYCSLSVLFSDWDRSGRVDLRVTNDRNYYSSGSDQLWRMAPGETPRLYTDADGWVALQVFGMGIGTYDVNGDGYPDYFITSQGDNKLQVLTAGPGQPTYRDIAGKRGVTAARPFTGGDVLPSTAWHSEFQDVNNDGFMDLFISKGNVSAQADYAQKDPSDLFLGRPDGLFKEGADAAGIVSFARGRGAALADFNLDGMLDLVEVNYGAPVKVWRNAGSGNAASPSPQGNWLALRLSQPGGNRDAIGAWIEVQVGSMTLRREVTIGGGHAGGELGWIHFGLGPATNARLRVVWPDGTTGPWMDAAANQFLDVEQGKTAPAAWQPPA